MSSSEMKIIIVKESEPYSSTKVAFRARREDGTSLYMGEETREALVKRIRDFHPDAEITDAEPAPGAFYWVRGRGVCRYSHDTGKVSHVVNPYQFTSDEWGGDLYVDPKDIMRTASDEDREMYRNNVRDRLTLPEKKT